MVNTSTISTKQAKLPLTSNNWTQKRPRHINGGRNPGSGSVQTRKCGGIYFINLFDITCTLTVIYVFVWW